VGSISQPQVNYTAQPIDVLGAYVVAAGAAGWINLDISATVPASARVVECVVSHNSVAAAITGIRADGSTISARWQIAVGDQDAGVECAVTTLGILEVYRLVGVAVTVKVIRYTE